MKGYTIYKIAKHTDWSSDYADTALTFNIGFIGTDSTTQKIYNAFLFAEKFRKLKKKSLKTFYFENIEDIRNVRVLYVNGKGKLDLSRIKSKISGHSVLLCTEGYPFEETMINVVAESKIGRFEVNQTNMRKAGLTAQGRVTLFSSRSEENITNTEDLMTMIRAGKDVELDAQDLAVLVDEYKQMLDQIDQQKLEIADQTAELEELVTLVEEKQNQIKLQQKDLSSKEAKIAMSKKDLEMIMLQNDEQQAELAQTEINLRKEMRTLDSVHVLLEKEQKTFLAELAIQDSLLNLKRIEIKNNQMTIDSQQEDLEVKEEKIEQQKLLIWAGVVVTVIILAFAFMVYRNYKDKKRANAELASKNAIIERQKLIVEEKNKEVMDSITYARRIQDAILPPIRLVETSLPECFVLYKPKDIVAGDFYWLENQEEMSLFAAADCTGHGVPGAMVSVVCNNALNRSVREFGLTVPGEILDKTRELVIQQFEKSDEDVKDGMDVALCSLKKDGDKSTLCYAGANNALWIIRKGADEVEECKANKQPIGQVDDPQPFSTHTFILNPGDCFYIFSDGYVDQFGGEKGKKFKTKPFKQLLLSIQKGPMKGQHSVIDEAFEAWRGDLEQVDDVCVIGVRI
jgi:serine phosphatase RsbU (regulator of sigma subunit)